MALIRSLAVALALAITTTGCGDDADVPAEGITVVDAWVRPTPAGVDEAAMYVTIENRGAPDDRLVGAASDRCMVVTPHVTEIDDDQVASMDEATGDRLDLADGATVEMGPLGLHLMCLGLAEPFAIGEEVPLELRFAEHAPLAVAVTVEQR